MPLSWSKKIKSSSSRPSSSSAPQIDWLSNAAQIAELAAAAGELLPFPYLKGAALVVLQMLKPIQQFRRNREDFEALTVSITNLLQIIHEEVSKNGEYTLLSDSFEEQCKNFNSCLQHITDDLSTLSDSSNSKFYVKYLTADRVKDRLAGYQKEIEDLRINFMFRNSVNTRMTLSVLQPSTHLNISIRIISQFRQIPLGDIEIVHRQSENSSSSCEEWLVHVSDGSRTKMARVYKGTRAIERWKEEIKWHSQIRHPYVLQLFGLFSYNDNRGLIFQNDLCISYDQYSVSHLKPGLDGLANFHKQDNNYVEALNYIRQNLSLDSFLSSDISVLSQDFIDYKEDTGVYILRAYVNVTDDRGIYVLEWTPAIEQDITLYTSESRIIGNTSPLERQRIVEAILDISFSPSEELLWGIYDAIYLYHYRDIAYPTNPVSLGHIVLGEIGLFGYSSHLTRVASLPSDDFPVEVCLSLQIAHNTPLPDVEVVIDSSICGYRHGEVSETSARAYVSQLAYLCSILNHQYNEDILLVAGFSWHIKIPGMGILSAEFPDIKELYLFIEAPQLHSETLDMYWSLDPIGSDTLECSKVTSFGLPPDSVKTFKTLSGCNLGNAWFQDIQDVHEKFGIDSDSNEATQLLGLPLMEIYQLENEELGGEGGHSSDSYHTADDDDYVDCE
ncbi:hypothetical protein M422DRAFT_272599 [Sphaerobolus stellatus SS14]|uniref:Protein kinase domain-containing protein n=1 Tax=Sphaerobolus stellatus (strain SS14) TaxID=990650 RepID=A0A0C9UB99_SPHS4|nr:hypothetical protein M422DRAFT_272599 [Sphaerobolus stellatus SS14]